MIIITHAAVHRQFIHRKWVEIRQFYAALVFFFSQCRIGVRPVLGRGFLFDGDTGHILINAASSLQLAQNKPAHYPPFKKNEDGQRRRRMLVHELFLLITGPYKIQSTAL